MKMQLSKSRPSWDHLETTSGLKKNLKLIGEERHETTETTDLHTQDPDPCLSVFRSHIYTHGSPRLSLLTSKNGLIGLCVEKASLSERFSETTCGRVPVSVVSRVEAHWEGTRVPALNLSPSGLRCVHRCRRTSINVAHVDMQKLDYGESEGRPPAKRCR
jgi:hypothetical protein